MSEEQYHSASHCKYLIQYHIIWCPKFRFSVLQGNVDTTLKQILQKICDDYGYQIKALEVMPDHIHIFVDVPQTVAPCDVVRTLKSISAIELFNLNYSWEYKTVGNLIRTASGCPYPRLYCRKP